MKPNFVTVLQDIDLFVQQKYPQQEFKWIYRKESKLVEYCFYDSTNQISVVCGFTCDSYNHVEFYIHERCYLFGKQTYTIYYWDLYQETKNYLEFEKMFNERNSNYQISWANSYYNSPIK